MFLHTAIQYLLLKSAAEVSVIETVAAMEETKAYVI